MRTMRDKMVELEKNTIDIGRNPSKAIQEISNPQLDKLHESVNSTHQPILEENMYQKGKLEAEETELNAQIYDHQIKQVSIKQELID